MDSPDYFMSAHFPDIYFKFSFAWRPNHIVDFDTTSFFRAIEIENVPNSLFADVACTMWRWLSSKSNFTMAKCTYCEIKITKHLVIKLRLLFQPFHGPDIDYTRTIITNYVVADQRYSTLSHNTLLVLSTITYSSSTDGLGGVYKGCVFKPSPMNQHSTQHNTMQHSTFHEPIQLYSTLHSVSRHTCVWYMLNGTRNPFTRGKWLEVLVKRERWVGLKQ